MVAKIHSVSKILKSINLNVTDVRRLVLLQLMEPGVALTQKEIEEALEQELGQVDRVTLYRTIRILLEKEVIHQITIDAQTVKYKLAGNNRKNDHPHFHCSLCDNLVCMPQIKIDEQMLPGGYLMQSSNLLIEGVCAICNKEEKGQSQVE
jgi:Fur family transcriptional regulator, ferric uptake regulator